MPERMLAVYASRGRPRRELHQSVGAILTGEPDCDARTGRGALQAAGRRRGVRRRPAWGKRRRSGSGVFSAAAPHLRWSVSRTRSSSGASGEMKGRIAADLGDPGMRSTRRCTPTSWTGRGYGLRRLRVAVGPAVAVQRGPGAGVPFRAERMVVVAPVGFRAILRHVKLARLLHDIRRLGDAKCGDGERR